MRSNWHIWRLSEEELGGNGGHECKSRGNRAGRAPGRVLVTYKDPSHHCKYVDWGKAVGCSFKNNLTWRRDAHAEGVWGSKWRQILLFCSMANVLSHARHVEEIDIRLRTTSEVGLM